MESIGLGLSAISLLAAFKGAIDGYLLIESIFDKDNGIRDLSLEYRIERHLLEVWGDRFNVKAAKEEDCLLYRESNVVKGLMAEIFGRIARLHAEADAFLVVHKAGEYKVDYEKLQTSGSGFNKQLQIDSDEVKVMSTAQMSKKQKHRVKWVVKNKDKFEEVVKKLRQANVDLDKLLSEPSRQASQKALPAYVLAPMNSVGHLHQAQALEGQANELLRRAAQLKLLQTTSSVVVEPSVIDYNLLKPLSSNPDEARKMCIYNNVTFSWVEWLEIERSHTPVEETHIRQRIKTLSIMLESTPPAFRVAKCIGCTSDPDNPFRIGLVYRTPEPHPRTTPNSLYNIITQYTKLKDPPLGDKFLLAHTLATTLMQLHAANWLHKGFRADNILFFSNDINHPDIKQPYLAGFEYARDQKMQSIGYRPSGKNSRDYYYHPNVSHGFTKVLDLYSLGVVLLEIAFWRPLGPQFQKNKAGSLEAMRDLCLQTAAKSAGKVDAAMGTIYADAVRKCLRCEFENLGEEEFACAMNTDVVLPLERCKA